MQPTGEHNETSAMQFKWKTLSSPSSFRDVAPDISKLCKVFPCYHILCFFQIIPSHLTSSSLNIRSRYKKIPIRQAFFSLLVLGFLFTNLLHDVVIFFLYSDFWRKLNTGNRVISLLISIRYILIFWKNCCSITLMIWKSRDLQDFIADLNILTAKLTPPPTYFKKHSRLFLILYIIPFLLIGIRVTVSAYMLAKTQPFRLVEFGFTVAPAWAKYTFYYFAEVLGGILVVAVYIQISALARILRICCHNFNKKLSKLRDRIAKEPQLNAETFETAIREMRELHETLIRAYHQYEDLFSLQILAAVLNNTFIVFSAMASYFVPKVTTGAIIIHTLSIISFLYVIVILPFFPIELGEESEKTIEILQDLVHKREMAVPPATGFHKRTLEEFALMTNFVQRVTTKPLTITAGGFMYLNRSFVISMGAVIIGFVLFLMERVEGQRGPEVICGNTTEQALSGEIG